MGLALQEPDNALYKYNDVVSGFANDSYWSSLEYDAGKAWYQSFSTAYQSNFWKDKTRLVRAVRAF